jgi:hypothetical protein
MTWSMKSERAAKTGPGARAILLAAAFAACAGTVNAQQSVRSLRDSLLGGRNGSESRKTPPPAARYVSETGDVFVLDRGARQPLMKFEKSSEVWVLFAHPAPRGDTIYKNELGEPVLRASKLGGMTLFTSERPAGDAVALIGQASSIQPPPFMSVNALFQRLLQASVRASRAAQHGVSFEAIDDASGASDDVTPGTSVLVADTATVTAEALERMASTGDRALLSRVVRVLLVRGPKPSASLKGGDLTVTYAPDKGLAGRPSSKRIIKVVTR